LALKEKITQKELILYEILKHPALCGQFIRNVDKQEYEDAFEYSKYQDEFACDFNNEVSICCARAVGKTVVLVDLICWVMINNVFPGDYINYHVPGKSHVEPVFTGLEKQFRGNSLLKHFIPKNRGINRSDLIVKPTGDRSWLDCRIAGQTGTGASVVGAHSPFVLVDESGYYPWGTWSELQPTRNTFTSGHRLIVSGVPTGVRENNVCYHADMENSKFTKHRVSAYDNPRFTEEDEKKAIEAYGGKDSEDFIHLVLGQHGKPVFALFDRNSMQIDNKGVFKLVIDGIKMGSRINEYYERILAFPGLPNKSNRCIFGIDLGYTEPTAIIILYEDSVGRLKFHGRIRLTKVNYYIQQKIIDWLDTKFNPIIIGIDEGSAGKAVIPTLKEHEEFIHKDFDKKIIPINFSSQIILGMDSEGKEIKSKTKPFSVGILQSYTNNHKIVYSSTDLEMITELERMTYTKTPSGEIVYRTLTQTGGKKGEDHFTAALLCASLAYYLEVESLDFKPKKRKLAKAYWNIGG
jgi:hypothetical protein